MTAQDARPAGDTIDAGTQMGPVELRVEDLGTMLAYYRDALALDQIDDAGSVVTLGRHGVPTVVLKETKGLPHWRKNQAGLYHTAVLFDSREGLAAAVLRAAQATPDRFTGSADHLVSEAFYFDDPEGNGVELYFDRPRESWSVAPDGTIAMAVDPLDPNRYLQDHLTEKEVENPSAPARIGHVHLQVGDIAAAKDFYVDALGFEIKATYHGALFVSAGGYHHHLGLNTWNSAGAPERASTLGLGTMDVVVPDAESVGALRERLAFHRIEAADDGKTLRFRDPWRSEIRVTSGA